jgi:hypothetical protein
MHLLRPIVSVYLPAALALLWLPSPASAQEDEPEEEEGEGEGEEEAARARRRPAEEEELEGESRSTRARSTQKKKATMVREVVKGAYAKVNLGPIFWLPPISSSTNTTGTETDFAFGYDVVDRLSWTLSIEVDFVNIITNGCGVMADPGSGGCEYVATETNGDGIAGTSFIQGDFRILGGTANLRIGPNFGGKRVKRASLAVQVGGGVGYSPPLIDIVSPNVQLRTGGGPLLQGRALGLITPGIGFEYYTKLAHFSVGADVDTSIIVGGPRIAAGVALDFFVKYTF